jgi:hypothetical protein|tara:strand:+ start:1209 stop:1658 length:450 start_codon:yes stop_codon:yes gene_type:complete
MINFQDLLKKQNQNQLILAVLLVIYIVFDVPIPDLMKPFVNHLVGQVVIVLLAIMLLVYFNPILGILGLLVAFLIIRKNKSILSHISVSPSVSTEPEKHREMKKLNVNNNQESLEIDMVNKMTPLVSNMNFSNPSYKPVLEDKVKGSNL